MPVDDIDDLDSFFDDDDEDTTDTKKDDLIIDVKPTTNETVPVDETPVYVKPSDE